MSDKQRSSAWRVQLSSGSMGRNTQIKDEMRLMDHSWEKMSHAHSERVDVTIIDGVIITAELK
jgi:hypothetical protein